MLWLNYLRQDGEAYHDLKRYLDEQKARTLESVMHAKDLDTVNKIKGRVECLTDLQLTVTQEERAERERAQRTDARDRETRGETRAPR